MAFRRPRVNVKPNVQTSRPVPTTVRSQEIPILTQEEPETQQIEITAQPVATNDVSDSIPNVEPLPIEESPTIALVPPPPPPPSTAPIIRPFRRKILPNIGVKTAIHHRRPSASCSGTESESESTRQKHAIASTITFGRVPPTIIKPTSLNETQSNLSSEPVVNEDLSTTTKTEATLVESPDLASPTIEVNSSQVSSRTHSKISREYLTQHINYRAQRLAAKVEPEMTIRKRRAATLEKLDEAGVNKGGPIDTSKLKIADFVHYNPTANPMEVKIKNTVVDTTKDPVRKQSMSSTDGANTSVAAAPQLKIDANGMLVVDEESLYIRNMDDTPRNTVIVEGQFNDDNLTHQSYRKIGRRKRWNNRDTLRFYQALRMCGTDFTLIARVFPNRDRDDIKRKFKTEDKAHRTLIDSALRQKLPFDLTCFYSPSEESTTDEENEMNTEEQISQKKRRKRRTVKRKSRQATSSDPLEINRRREKRLQSKKNSGRIKKSAEFINDDDDDNNNNNDEEDDEDDDDDEVEDSSMDIADTVEITTTAESKSEQIIPSTQATTDNSLTDFNGLENLLGRIDGGHLLFVHNTDETTGLDRIDVHVVRSNSTDQN